MADYPQVLLTTVVKLINFIKEKDLLSPHLVATVDDNIVTSKMITH